MHLSSPIVATLLLTAPLASAYKSYNPGGKVDIEIYFFTNKECRSAVVAKNAETSNTNNALKDYAISYRLSRNLRENEKLDFSVKGDNNDSPCGKYISSAIGKRREGNKCQVLDEQIACWRLWTDEEARKLGTGFVHKEGDKLYEGIDDALQIIAGNKLEEAKKKKNG